MGPNKDLSMSSIPLQLLLHVGQGTELAGIDQVPSGPLSCIFPLPFFFSLPQKGHNTQVDDSVLHGLDEFGLWVSVLCPSTSIHLVACCMAS